MLLITLWKCPVLCSGPQQMRWGCCTIKPLQKSPGHPDGEGLSLQMQKTAQIPEPASLWASARPQPNDLQKGGGPNHISQLGGIEGTFAHIPNAEFRILIPDFDLDLGYLVTESYVLLFQVCIKHLWYLLPSERANFLSSHFQTKPEVISSGERQHMFRLLITQLQQLTPNMQSNSHSNYSWETLSWHKAL